MKQILSALLFLGLFASSPVSAVTIDMTIEDTYIGQMYQNKYAHNGGDVIAGNSGNKTRQEAYINEFDIDGMRVDIDGEGNVRITILTDYYPNISGYGTTYGDLFISTDGWDQDINSTFYTSTDGSGEYWEFVFDTDTGGFYRTNGGAYLLSENFFGPGSGNGQPSSYYRRNQLVQINADALESPAITTGSFFTTKDENGNNVLVYEGFNLEDMGLSLTESWDLAFRWTMTCANDVIEGGFSWQAIPEPGTMALLGLGLLGLGAVGRRLTGFFDAGVERV